MSRLYIKNQSDLSKTGQRASQRAHTAIYYGSKHDSKIACSLDVNYPKNTDQPTIILRIPYGLNYTIERV